MAQRLFDGREVNRLVDDARQWRAHVCKRPAGAKGAATCQRSGPVGFNIFRTLDRLRWEHDIFILFHIHIR